MEALYRKYRPKNFYEIEGQEHIKKLFKNALEKRTINHAYIFLGPRGTGKTTTARILAKSLNCEKNQFGEPCNECVSCKAIDSSSHLDVIELDAASNRGIDEIRKIKDGVNFTPVMGKYKVYIIDEVHMLTKEAFNALLKTLEEPPKHVVFILATTNPEKIPPTVSSRCHILEFRNISLESISKRLKQISQFEGYDISDDAVYKIAKRAAGGLRDALSILEQIVRYSGGEINSKIVDEALGLVDEDLIQQFIKSIMNHDKLTVEKIIDEVYIERGDFETFISQIIEICIENGSRPMINLAMELYKILKELKGTEEKLLIAKLLFFNLMEEFSNFSNDVSFLSNKNNNNNNNNNINKLENVPETFERKKQEREEKNVTQEILNELMLKGDLSLFIGLSLANINEGSEKIEITFDKSHQISYEIVKEKALEIESIYKNKSGLSRKVEIILADEEFDPTLQRLKMLIGDDK